MAKSSSAPDSRRCWTQAFDGVISGIDLVAGFAVVASLSADLPTHMVILAIAIMALGIREVAIGVRSPDRTIPIRVIDVTSGLAATNLGFLVAVFPGFGGSTRIWFLFLGLFGFGAAQIWNGLEGKQLRPWLRGYLVAVGMINLLLTPFLLLAPGRPQVSLVLLLSAAVVVDGVAIIVGGWRGRRLDIAPRDEPQVRTGDP
jgi:uncharacterized membrane protein HdeD (DUF308 family)